MSSATQDSAFDKMPRTCAKRGFSAILVAAFAARASAQTELISADPSGAVGNGDSVRVDISADARFVTFTSSASSLVPGDTNGLFDVFVRDRQLGLTTRVSVGPGGVEGDGASEFSKLSPDGRFVAFASYATNFVASDTNGELDVFVVDRTLGTIVRASVDASGAEADGASYAEGFSADDRWLAISSLATNLVPNDTNHVRDVFVRDLQTGQMELISVGPGGIQSNGATVRAALSADARYVAFESWGDDLVPNDTNGTMDVFVRDRLLGITTRESVGPNGIEADGKSDGPAISGDGRFVGFASYADNFVPNDHNDASEVFLRDRWLGTTELVNTSLTGGVPNSDSHLPGLSFDGRYVSFNSQASDVVPNDTNGQGDVFVLDRATHLIRLVSLATSGAQGDGLSIFPVISADGREVVYESASTDFTPGDANGLRDIFASSTGLGADPVTSYCTAKQNSAGCTPSIAFDGWPSVGAPSGFSIRALDVVNQKFGLLLYSTQGGAALAFGGGTLCCQAPLARTPLQSSLGNSSASYDCSGNYAFDFDAWIATGNDTALVAGAHVFAQYWSRDPHFAAPNGIGLTNALSFELGP